MQSKIFQDLAVVQSQRLHQDRELARIHQQLRDRGEGSLLVDEADLQAIEEIVACQPSPATSGGTAPTWAGARC